MFSALAESEEASFDATKNVQLGRARLMVRRDRTGAIDGSTPLPGSLLGIVQQLI